MIFIDILLTFILTSAVWYSVWLWYKPQFAKIISEYTVARSFEIFQRAMLQVALGQVPPLPQDPATPKDSNVN